MTVQTSYSLSPGAAYAGLVDRADLVEAKLQGEASAEIALGYAVKLHATERNLVVLPTTETDKIYGIVCRTHIYSPTVDIGTTGVKPGASLNIIRRGRVWVTAEDAVTYQGRGWVRCTTGGDAAEIVGGITAADEGTETIDCTGQIEFQADAAAGALVPIEVDFTREP